MCRGFVGKIGTPIFEDAHPRHLNQPDLYLVKVDGPWIPIANQEGLESSCVLMGPPGLLRRSNSRKEEHLKNKKTQGERNENGKLKSAS